MNGLETLTCSQCSRAWGREIRRGRKPSRCPDCTGRKVKPVRPPDPALVKALEVYARSTCTEAAAIAGVSNDRMRRFAEKAGVECGHTVPYTPGVVAYVDGCRCDVCTAAVEPIKGAAEGYLDGRKTLRELASELGVSHERIRNWLDMYIGGLVYDSQGRRVGRSGAAVELQRARRAEREALEADIAEQALRIRAEREGVSCVCCGRSHAREWQTGWASTCSPECAEMWSDVRYLLPEGQEKQQRRIARWQVAHPESVPDWQVRVAERRLSGEGPTYESGSWPSRNRTRWLVPGSRRFDIAVKAYRESWPSFETWPQDIQDQIREHVEQEEAA